MKTRTVEKLEIKIKRPGGNIETIVTSENVRYLLGTNQKAQEAATKATREAGKGQVLSFTLISEDMPMTDKEQRDYLVMEIGDAYSKFDYLREQDYNNDTGFHKSAPVELEIKAAEQALKDFDIANPELKAEIDAVKREKIARDIQSCLNS